jgi:hypothetical protein
MIKEQITPKLGRGNRNPRTPAQLEAARNKKRPKKLEPKSELEARKQVPAFISPLELQSILERSGCASFTIFAQAFAAGKIKIRK